MQLWNWLLAPWAWRIVRSTGVNVYVENSVTGERRVRRCARGGWQPVDAGWLAGLAFGAVMPLPPTGGTAVRR